MRILMLNWALHKSSNWHWDLMRALVKKYNYYFDIISGKRMWEGRGGFLGDAFEEEKGIQCHRIFDSIPEFRMTWNERRSQISEMELDSEYDHIWCCHQSNLPFAEYLSKVFKAPIVLFVEQAWRLSGIETGVINEAWRRYQSKTEIIMSTAIVDKKYEEKLGVHQVPTACFEGIEKLRKNASERLKNPLVIYQGSVMGKGWKNCRDFLKATEEIFKETLVKKFKIVGTPLDETARIVLGELRYKYQDKIEIIDFLPRDELLKELGKAFVAYCPVVGSPLTNFVLESWGCGTPVLLNHIQWSPVEVLTEIDQINQIWDSETMYEKYAKLGTDYYDENNSMNVAVEKYHSIFMKGDNDV